MATTRHMHIVSGVLLISFHLCTMTLINGSLSTLKRRQTQCPCRVEGTEVNCRYKSLNSIPSCIPANVTYLSLSNNRISHIEDFAFAGLHSLTYLSLYNNILTTITRGMFVNLTNVKSLRLEDNRISYIEDFAFAGMHSLTELYLYINNLTTITRRMFVNLTNVNDLWLSNNRISHIENFVFAEMHSLTALWLSYNHISHMEDFAFTGIQNLTELHLYGNFLKTIPREMFANLTSIQTIDLRHNVGLQLHDVIRAFKHKDGFLLKQIPGEYYYKSEKQCSCQYVNIQRQIMSDCTNMTQTNLTSVIWNNSSFCFALNDVTKSSTYGAQTSHMDIDFILATDPVNGSIYKLQGSAFNYSSRLPLVDLRDPLAVDFDDTARRIYWTSYEDKQIFSASLDGRDRRVVFSTGQNSQPYGIAVDGRSRLIFYTDEGTRSIAFVTITTQMHKIIINSSLDKPRAIVLDKENGVIMWSDWGRQPKIEQANYDGSDRYQLVNTSLAYPNGLALDMDNNLLYWSDAGTDKVECLDLEGNIRTVIFQAPVTSHFFGLAVDGLYLYLVDSPGGFMARESHVLRMNRDGTDQQRLFTVDSILYDIHFYTKAAFNRGGSNGCRENNGGCSHICIPTSGNSTRCLCPEGYCESTGFMNCTAACPEA